MRFIQQKFKNIYRYGCAKALLNGFEEARKYFRLTQEIKPNCPAVATHLAKLALDESKYKAQEKFMCQKMFQQPKV